MTSRKMNRFKVSKKRGEHGHTIVGIRHGRAMPTLYCTEVLNIEQVERLHDDEVPTRAIIRNPAERCTTIVTQMPRMPLIIWNGKEVYYNLKEDRIYVPKLQSFDNGLQYHSALFYALAQCTGHALRRNRDTCVARYAHDPKTYSCEELIVEMIASYLCSYCGIEPWYLTKYHADSKGWLRRLQMDTTFAITAAMYAQEAVNYILNRSFLANPIQTGVYTPTSKFSH